jgi:uncharacterized membrane protein YkoI
MMKKKGWIIGLGLVVALGGTSAVVAAEATSSYIGKNKAKQIALQAVPGTVTDIELERERGTVYYEVDIDRKDTLQEADVHVEALTGKVLKVKNDDDDARRTAAAPVAPAAAQASPVPGKAAAEAPAATAAPAATVAPATAAPTTAAAPATAASATQVTPKSGPATAAPVAAQSITKEQAGKLAQQAVKGDIVRVETDWDDGIKQYEVKLRTATGTAEVDIDAVSGKVLDVDYDDDDRYDNGRDDDEFDDDDRYDNDRDDDDDFDDDDR